MASRMFPRALARVSPYPSTFGSSARLTTQSPFSAHSNVAVYLGPVAGNAPSLSVSCSVVAEHHCVAGFVALAVL